MKRNIRVAIFIILSSAAAFLSGEVVHAGEQMTLQVHPYLAPSELLRRFAPLISYLSEKSGNDITCEISKNYSDHIKKVGRDQVDIAYMGPASYVEVVTKYGSKPILARLEVNGSPSFKGVIITGKTSPIHTIKDLKGKRFAFGDRHSTMSFLVPLNMLHSAGISYDSLGSYEFLNSHENVVLGILMGDFDAGAVKEEVYHDYMSRGLREIARTPEISEHLFVTRSTLPEDIIRGLREALLSIQRKSIILTSIKKDVTALVPASDEDYDNLRRILETLPQLPD